MIPLNDPEQRGKFQEIEISRRVATNGRTVPVLVLLSPTFGDNL